jgi:hypothetical protein
VTVALVVVAGVVVAVVGLLLALGGHREDGRLCSCQDCRESRARQAWVRKMLAEAQRGGDVEDARERAARWREL